MKVIEKLFICDVVCLALSVLGMYVMYAYETMHMYDIYSIYAIIIEHALAYNALGCMIIMLLTPILTIIMKIFIKKK